MNQWEYEEQNPEFPGEKVIENHEEDEKLNEFFEIFSAMPKSDLANEYRAYQKDKYANLKEKQILEFAINKIKDPKTSLESWVKNHKLTKSDNFDLEFSDLLNRRGINVYEGDLASVKLAINKAGYKNLWAGKKKDKGPENTEVMRGYTQDIWYMDADYVRNFAIKRYENAEKIKQRLQKR